MAGAICEFLQGENFIRRWNKTPDEVITRLAICNEEDIASKGLYDHLQ